MKEFKHEVKKKRMFITYKISIWTILSESHSLSANVSDVVYTFFKDSSTAAIARDRVSSVNAKRRLALQTMYVLLLLLLLGMACWTEDIQDRTRMPHMTGLVGLASLICSARWIVIFLYDIKVRLRFDDDIICLFCKQFWLLAN